jgi:hypothetical protein
MRPMKPIGSIARKSVKTKHERFESRALIVASGCWEWQAARHYHGYGLFGDTYAHLYSYRHHYGDIPVGLEIDHVCANKRCVNPKHLEAVTHLENVRRAVQRRRELQMQEMTA